MSEENIIEMPLMKEMFINTVKQMVNELDLVFEYIPKDTINKLNKYIDKLQSNDAYFNSQSKEIYAALKEHEHTLTFLYNNAKIRGNQLEFLHTLVVFDSSLDCNVFKNENKNTRKEIVKYFATLYMCSCFLQNEFISESLESFIKTIQRPIDQKKTSSNKKFSASSPNNQMNLFENLLSNPNIMNLANDLTKELDEKKIEPMSLLSSILSGKPNDILNELVTDISSKIETKINSGEIDKKELEEQAKTMLNAVSSSNSDLFKVLKNLKKP